MICFCETLSLEKDRRKKMNWSGGNIQAVRVWGNLGKRTLM